MKDKTQHEEGVHRKSLREDILTSRDASRC